MGESTVALLSIGFLAVGATAIFFAPKLINANDRKLFLFHNILKPSPRPMTTHSFERILHTPFRRRQVLDRKIGAFYYDILRRLKALSAETVFPVFAQVHVSGIIKCDDDDTLDLLNADKVDFCITNSVHIPLLVIDVIRSHEPSYERLSKKHALERAGIIFRSMNYSTAVMKTSFISGSGRYSNLIFHSRLCNRY